MTELTDIYKSNGGKVILNYFIYSFLLLLLPLLLSHFSRVRLCATPETVAHQAPWDFPGKNIGVGCHFLLQCVKVKSESEVAQLCLTPSDPMDCSLPGSSVHGIFQARVLEWGAIAFSYSFLLVFSYSFIPVLLFHFIIIYSAFIICDMMGLEHGSIENK